MAHILIVDDDPDIVECVKVVLEQAGHTTVSAGCKEDGMRLAQSGKVDLLVLDIMMNEPDDGIALAQDLRRDKFAKPILMMSSISRVTGLSYGKDSPVTPVDDFVDKPVEPQLLLDKVTALLKKKKGGCSC